MSVDYIQARNEILTPFYDAWRQYGHTMSNVKFDDLPMGDNAGAGTWARVILRHNNGFQSSLTGPLEELKRWTSNGKLFIQLHCPIGQGNTELYKLAYAIVSAYRKATTCHVWFRNPGIREVDSRDMWSQLHVIVDFTYDSIQ